jgi:hypothetical protein
MELNRTDIDRVFNVGDVIASGGDKTEIRIADILDDRMRIASTSSMRKDRIWYSKLAVAVEAFESLDPHRIQSSIVELFKSRKLSFSQNETYLYGLAREFRLRTGVATAHEYDAELEERVQYSRGLSPEERMARLESPNARPHKALVTTTVYRRNPDVIAEVLLRANGVCEQCRNKAPFRRRDGEPYLEVHHMLQLARGGEDTVANAVAVCPNCHRRAHYG